MLLKLLCILISFLKIVPITTNINLPNGNVFAVGSDMSIQCDVQGYPKPIVTWYKDDVEIQRSDRIQISGNYCRKTPPPFK